MKKIAILGSTGSIGQNTVRVAKHLKDEVKVVSISAYSNIDLLEKQALDLHPEIIAVYKKDRALELKKRLPGYNIVAGEEGLEEAASYPSVNQVIVAIVGTAALKPTIAAIKTKKNIALSNKEILISAGSYIMNLAKEFNIELIPIDSEHSALFQCMQGQQKSSIRKLLLTASGGPFLNYSLNEMKKITVEDALAHPTWKMGKKITVDSSTLMNKGCEVIEAHYLFEIPVNQIEVIIHPQSIVHSMVEFQDNVLLAQLGASEMITPIQYSLTYPKRKTSLLKPFDITKYSQLNFYKPDFNKFTCLRLAYEAIKTGDSLPCYMNAANEVLVDRFLNKKITWSSISQKLEKLMEKHRVNRSINLESILETDSQARAEAQEV